MFASTCHWFARIAAIAVACYLLAGCGGGGGGGGGGVGTGNTLAGTMNVADFTVPAGQTRTVTADTTIRATGKIQIDGTILVPPDTSLSLIADGPLTITGSIDVAPGRGAPRRARSAVSRGGRQDAVLELPSILFVGKDVEVNHAESELSGKVTTPPGESLLISCSVPGGTITLDGTIRTGDGRPGAGIYPASPAPEFPAFAGFPQDGESAGDIRVGDTDAVEAAKKFSSPQAVAPSRIVVSGTVVTGSGGAGQPALKLGDTAFAGSSAIGLGLKPGMAAFSNSRGGTGGSIVLTASNGGTVSTAATVLSGDGGAAGAFGTQASPIGIGKATLGSPGKDIWAGVLRAGRAGSVSINLSAGQPAGTTGNRGAASAAWILGSDGGNGSPATPGKSATAPGNGGSVSIYVDEIPAKLTGPAPQRPDPPFAPINVSGSNGPDAPDPTVSAASGGTASFNNPIGLPGSFARPVGGAVTFTNFGNGGKGASGCSAVPQVSGSSGGNAGTVAGNNPSTALVLHGLKTEAGAAITPNYTNSFNGGNAGSGTMGSIAVALPGRGGLDDSPKKIGTDGQDSVACSSTAAYLVVALPGPGVVIDDSGDVAGLDSSSSTKDYKLFIATQLHASNFTSVRLPFDSNLGPISINGSAQVLDGFSTQQLWTPSAPRATTGTATKLPQGFVANAINDSGVLAGSLGPTPDSAAPTILRNGQIENLGSTVPLGSLFLGINKNGDLFGQIQQLDNQGQPTHKYDATLTRAYGNVNLTSDKLNALGGGRLAQNDAFPLSHCINSQGHIAAASTFLEGTPNSGTHAVLWQGATAIDLGTLGGNSYATAINDQDTVVGYSYTTKDPNTRQMHAFISINGGPMQDLNSLIDKNSLWTLTAATDINNSGEIVGKGGSPFGTFFKLVPIARHVAKPPTRSAKAATGVNGHTSSRGVPAAARGR